MRSSDGRAPRTHLRLLTCTLARGPRIALIPQCEEAHMPIWFLRRAACHHP
jgi:hypothetical protein